MNIQSGKSYFTLGYKLQPPRLHGLKNLLPCTAHETFGHPVQSKSAVNFTFSSCSLLTIEGVSPEVAPGDLYSVHILRNHEGGGR